MNRWGRRSLKNRATCHEDLQTIADQVLMHRDCSFIEGHRGKDLQNLYYDQKKSNKRWPKSKHNVKPSLAMHLVPYPLPDWDDIQAFKDFGNFVLGVAAGFDIPLKWGGHWKKPKDFIHFELLRR